MTPSSPSSRSQDVSGDVYYFNFSSGQSTWDHPCDEQYRSLVKQERERAGTQPHGPLTTAAKKKEKKKKDKKEPKKKAKDQELLKPPGVSGRLLCSEIHQAHEVTHRCLRTLQCCCV